MTTLNPPTPAFRWGKGDVLRTDPPRRLTERGYRPTSTGTREATDVDGVIPEAVIDAGVEVVYNTENKSLYRRTDTFVWESVSGKAPLVLPLDVIYGGYDNNYAGGY